MSTGNGKHLHRARPAATNREALSRWGFNGKPRLESSPAYTAEDLQEDEAAGLIVMPSRRCPCDRPERECQCEWCESVIDYKAGRFVAGDAVPVPHFYRCRWHQMLTYPPRKPTKGDPNPLPRRERTTATVICYECRLSIRAAERARFIHEHGHYRLEDGPLDVKRHYPDDDQEHACELPNHLATVIIVEQT